MKKIKLQVQKNPHTLKTIDIYPLPSNGMINICLLNFKK